MHSWMLLKNFRNNTLYMSIYLQESFHNIKTCKGHLTILKDPDLLDIRL